MKYSFPKIKTKKFQTKKKEFAQKDQIKEIRKGRHKDKTPTNDILRKEVTVVILGVSTLLNILVLGVALKFRSTELELDADIW